MSGAKILLFCRLSLFTKYHKMFKIAVSFSGGGSENKKRVCHKPHPIRPERAEALSPGHRPGF